MKLTLLLPLGASTKPLSQRNYNPTAQIASSGRPLVSAEPLGPNVTRRLLLDLGVVGSIASSVLSARRLIDQ